MRYIHKTTLGSNVLDRQNRIGVPQNSNEATERWNNFGKKSVVRNKLLPQQYGLCAYSEFNIAEFCSITSSKNNGCHIEHIKPKTNYPQLTFDYDNLIISVLDDQDLKKFSEDFFASDSPIDDNHHLYFAVHAKKSVYDAQRFISPTDSQCSDYFTYLEETGEIKPNINLSLQDTDKANYTINLLNLNHPYLKNQRRKRMDEVLEDIDTITDVAKMRRIIQDEISPDTNNQIASFPSAVESLVSQ